MRKFLSAVLAVMGLFAFSSSEVYAQNGCTHVIQNGTVRYGSPVVWIAPCLQQQAGGSAGSPIVNGLPMLTDFGVMGSMGILDAPTNGPYHQALMSWNSNAFTINLNSFGGALTPVFVCAINGVPINCLGTGGSFIGSFEINSAGNSDLIPVPITSSTFGNLIAGNHAFWVNLIQTGANNAAPADSYIFGNGLTVTDSMKAGAYSAGQQNALDVFEVDDFIQSGATGSRFAMRPYISVNAKPSDTGNVGSSFPAYTGVQSAVYLNTNLNGTSASSNTTAAGSIFGNNPNVALGSSATDIYALVGQETDVTAVVGSSMWQKIGLDVIQASNDGVQGAEVDAGFFLGNQIGAVGWQCGFCFAGNGSGAAFPITTTGTMIGTVGSGGMTALNGVDFSNVTFGGDAFKSTGFAVALDGSVAASNLLSVGNLGVSNHETTTIFATPGTGPVISSCGSSPGHIGAAANDVSGTIVPGSGVSACTVTFQLPYATIPRIFLTGYATSSQVLSITSATISAFTVTLYNSTTGSATNFSGTDGFSYHAEQ